MKVIVTGGSGMVGQSVRDVVGADNSSWIFLSSKDVDLTSYDATKAIFDKHQPTHVLHLAAMVGGLYRNLNNNLEMFRTNFSINDSVLRVAHEHQVQKVISSLSTCIFPDDVTYPLTEEMVHDGPPHNSNYGYSYAKRMLDVLTRGYNSQYGYRWSSIIPCNIYGPYDNFNLEDSHVIPGLIHKTYLAKRDGKPLVVFGSGKPLRQFTYSRDLAQLLVWCVEHYEDTEPIILSVGEEDEITIDQAVQSIVKAMGFAGDVIHDTSKSDGQHKKTASNAKLKGLVPNFKFTPFEIGIKDTCDWFCDNFATARR